MAKARGQWTRAPYLPPTNPLPLFFVGGAGCLLRVLICVAIYRLCILSLSQYLRSVARLGAAGQLSRRPAGKYSDTRPGKYSGAGFGDVCRAPPRGVDPLAAREDSTITAACRQEVIRGPSAKTLFQPLPSP